MIASQDVQQGQRQQQLLTVREQTEPAKAPVLGNTQKLRGGLNSILSTSRSSTNTSTPHLLVPHVRAHMLPFSHPRTLCVRPRVLFSHQPKLRIRPCANNPTMTIVVGIPAHTEPRPLIPALTFLIMGMDNAL
jgi:hypothetical protein